MSSHWESVIGLEIHVQLATASKIFSSASTTFGAQPNTQACELDIALPGTLPVLNKTAVEMAVRFGVAIGAEIHPVSVFDRKNYFYPDLPKGYQISQFEHPIVGRGYVDVNLEDGTTKRVGITRAHLEEDAGKSLHEDFAGQSGIDLNRAGTPLLEIVSEPDLRSSAEAAAYFRQMHTLVRYLRICDGNLNEGSMRCDANVSVRHVGAPELGQRTEIKNLNSFRFLARAIDHEIERQIEVLEHGGSIERETLQYDAERDETRAMRGKEQSDDYRYFPEPDLLPVHLEPAFIDAIRDSLPELPEQKLQRYCAELGLPQDLAGMLIIDPTTAAYFEQTVAANAEPRLAATWITGELAAAANRVGVRLIDAPVAPHQLAELLENLADDTISGPIAKRLFEQLWELNDPRTAIAELIDSQGLRQLSDTDALSTIVAQILADNPAQVDQYRAGKVKVLGFFVGQVMQHTQGKANPKQVNTLLREALAKD